MDNIKELNKIYSDEEFRKLLDKLNAVTIEYSQWKPTKAQKEHEDNFGDSIGKGEIYYNRKYGQTYDEVIKLSIRSMEILLFSIFSDNHILKTIGDHFIEERRQKQQEAVNKLTFL